MQSLITINDWISGWDQIFKSLHKIARAVTHTWNIVLLLWNLEQILNYNQNFAFFFVHEYDTSP